MSRATSIGMIISGQIIASLAFGCQSLLYAVASEILPRLWRPMAQGGLNITLGLSGMFTVLVGFTLTKDNPDGFRIFFYICAGVQALAVLICFTCYNPPPRPLQNLLSTKEKLVRVRESLSFIVIALKD